MHRTAIVTRADAGDTLELPIVTPAALPRTSFILRVLSGPDAGKILNLDPTSPPHAVLGQASSCAIQLNDPHVSRRHVALTATATHALLVDLGSMNGTRVNGVLVREARLYGGETIALGKTLIGVESDQATAANVPGTLPPPAEGDYINSVLGERLAFTEARQRVVAEFERRYVEDLLVRHNGNVTHAARASGVAHRYFQLVRARSR
jgi:pSer/pThr/pTyr-binding forkhead associated (FHA) protein